MNNPDQQIIPSVPTTLRLLDIQFLDAEAGQNAIKGMNIAKMTPDQLHELQIKSTLLKNKKLKARIKNLITRAWKQKKAKLKRQLKTKIKQRTQKEHKKINIKHQYNKLKQDCFLCGIGSTDTFYGLLATIVLDIASFITVFHQYDTIWSPIGGTLIIVIVLVGCLIVNRLFACFQNWHQH